MLNISQVLQTPGTWKHTSKAFSESAHTVGSATVSKIEDIRYALKSLCQ